MNNLIKKNNFFFLFSLLLLVIGFSSGAHCDELKKLRLKEVVKSAQKNYPKILALYQEVNAAKGSILSSQGFFDVKLRQSFSDRSRGFYDGKTLNSEIVKKNQFLGSEIYSGYRKSFGSFDNHETKYKTNNDGEFRIGARFSLLRNATIDESRLSLLLARLDLEESKFALKNIKNEIRRDATKAYYDWVIFGKIYKIYQNLYELALSRNEKLAIKVKKGDLAKIILVENERNALSRKTSMIKAKQDFENAGIYLSLFYRDNNGRPIIPRNNQAPDIKIKQKLNLLNAFSLDKDITKALQDRADINVIRIAKRKARGELKQAKNLYKPKLDFEISASNDISNESQSRGQSKNEIGLQFEIPLQQRKAKGEIAKSNSKISKIKYEETLLIDTVRVTLQQIKNTLDNVAKMHDNLSQEVELSVKLEDAEKTRFTRGGSDFFLINLREQKTASAKIENSLIFGKYYKTLADYKAETFSK